MSIAFSANLGFLWTELSLPDAIRAAANTGFKAVELHWPYAVDAALVRQALDETGLPILGLNTPRGDVDAGEFGLAALPGREADARATIDQAIDYAIATDAKAIHVMAGKTSATAAKTTFIANLRYAADKAGAHGISILLEPLNGCDVPGYFLLDNALAASIIAETGRDNIRIMFDCYHAGRRGENVLQQYLAYQDQIGHVQFAAVPDRGEPDHGDVDFHQLLPQIAEAGYGSYFGAEYKPRQSTDAGLGWLCTWDNAK